MSTTDQKEQREILRESLRYLKEARSRMKATAGVIDSVIEQVPVETGADKTLQDCHSELQEHIGQLRDAAGRLSRAAAVAGVQARKERDSADCAARQGLQEKANEHLAMRKRYMLYGALLEAEASGVKEWVSALQHAAAEMAERMADT